MGPVPEDEAKNVDNDPDCVENIEFPDIIIPNGPSDSDEFDEGPDLGGYQLLPQDPIELSNGYLAGADEEDEENTPTQTQEVVASYTVTENSSETTTNQPWKTSGPADSSQPHLTNYPGSAGAYLQAPELPRPEKGELLWNQPSNVNSINMDEKHAAEIKAAMAGFQLPLSNVPDWAKNVSDDQWKETIIPKILSPQKSESDGKT